MEEQVALYDEQGRPDGSAPRSRMRAENLRHAATAVVVRDSWGRVYVHRRTASKDVYPSRRDFAAGGVIAAGEEPLAAAVRELDEELGVTGVELVPLLEGDYADDHTRYHAFCYQVSWDGPIRWQPEEVVAGGWMTMERLVAEFTAQPEDFMPDTVGVLGGWARERVADRSEPVQGWDSETTLVEGRWVDRRPRRPEVATRLVAETRLLPRIAPTLGLAVPEPVVLETEPVLLVRHRLVTGRPAEPAQLTAVDGAAVARFLRALHETPGQVYADTGVPSADEARSSLLTSLAHMGERILPMLPVEAQPVAGELLNDVAAPGPTCLVHGDLGPDHLLVEDGRVCGVIDWSDTVVGDPGLDLAWTLHGTPAGFADSLAASYGVTPVLRARALLWHRLGPWWEALGGLDFLGPATLASGLAGILARLGPPS